MIQNSEPATPQISPLSEHELAVISGGLVNVSLTLMIAENDCEFINEFSSGGHSSSVTSGRSGRSLFGLQFSGSFESMDHFFSCFSRVMDYFGRR